jgi:hypothetical protein
MNVLISCERAVLRERTDGPGTRKSPVFRGFSSAPERTRTSTDQLVHKALNHVPRA